MYRQINHKLNISSRKIPPQTKRSPFYSSLLDGFVTQTEHLAAKPLGIDLR